MVSGDVGMGDETVVHGGEGVEAAGGEDKGSSGDCCCALYKHLWTEDCEHVVFGGNRLRDSDVKCSRREEAAWN